MIGFVMKQDRLEFPEAVRMLAKKVNVVIPETKGTGGREKNIRQLIFKINALAAEYFRRNLLNDRGKPAKEARNYLKKRKIDLKTVEQFQLGFAVDQWDGLIEYLRGKKINLGLMEKAGLILSREKGQGYYDRFLSQQELSSVKTIGLAFNFQVLESIPVLPHDRPVDRVISD